MRNPLFMSKTYTQDLELFKELGLDTFETNDNEWVFVGEYKLPNYDVAKVKIYVMCMPAQFWKFEIETEEDMKFEIKTGSGYLSTYWESIMLVATGMFVAKELK